MKLSASYLPTAYVCLLLPVPSSDSFWWKWVSATLRLNLQLFPPFFDFAHHFFQVFLGYSIYSYLLIPSKRLNTHGLSISQKLINKQDKYQTNHDIASPITASWWSFLFLLLFFGLVFKVITTSSSSPFKLWSTSKHITFWFAPSLL